MQTHALYSQRFLPLASLLFCLSASVATAQTDGRENAERQMIQMRPGDQRTLSVSGLASLVPGPEGIVEFREDRRSQQVIIVAQRPGNTSALVTYQDGRRPTLYVIRVASDTGGVREGGVDPRENIRLDFYFVQLSETYSNQIGVGFPGSVGGQVTTNIGLDFTAASPITAATASIVSSFLPRIDIAESVGWARLMRQAMVVTANGTQAQMNSGGQVNLVTQNTLGTQLARIDYGSQIDVTPHYDPVSRRIEVEVQAEVSDLTAPVGGVPGLTRTHVRSIVNLELGQSIVLGGLTSTNASRATSGLPGLGQIPILGLLFASQTQLGNNVENLIFIVPTVVQAVPREERNRIAEVLRVYRDFGNIGARGLSDIELMEASPPGY